MRHTCDCAGSSNVVNATYDDDVLNLDVEYKGGTIYRYSGVNSDEWMGLQGASSKGSFIAQQIKPNHTMQKIYP